MTKSTAYILALNCGSSSLKFSLYQSTNLHTELSGVVNHIGKRESFFEIQDSKKNSIYNSAEKIATIEAAIKLVLKWFRGNLQQYPLAAIGHRVVQGGPCHREPEIADDYLPDTLTRFIYLAPNHLPDEISAIKLCKSTFPDITQVVCFDTAFHKDMPDRALYYPLPVAYREEGLMRYGFHGLSYEYVLKQLADKKATVKKEKIIIAHLGNGASMVAVKNGVGIETTMGLSPMGGLVMGTRPGDIDPGVPLFLLKKIKMSVDEVDELLNKKSGLKAMAGTADVEQLLAREEYEPTAKEALNLFCYQAQKHIGALAAALGGLDRLVFTGGIGENSAVIRKRICKELGFLGIHLHKKSNKKSRNTISSIKSKVKVQVIKTNEELMIAHHTKQLLQ